MVTILALAVMIRSPVAAAPYVLLLGIPVAIAAMLREDGREYRLLALYGMGFVLWIHVRAWADELGPSPFVVYPIAGDRVLGLGVTPTARLQDLFGRDGPLVWAAVGVHLSYFIIPSLTATLAWLRGTPLLARYVFATLIACYTGLIVHVLAPSVPPWMAGAMGVLPEADHLMGRLFFGIEAYHEGVGFSLF